MSHRVPLHEDLCFCDRGANVGHIHAADGEPRYVVRRVFVAVRIGGKPMTWAQAANRLHSFTSVFSGPNVPRETLRYKK
jgi:hypothetical protein